MASLLPSGHEDFGEAGRPSLPPPRTPDPLQAPALNWGVVGPGGIAAAFTDAVHTHTTQRVVAVSSRSTDRARAFASRFDVPAAYGGHDALLEDERVQVVYVASPHSEHFPHALAAIEAGKAVLLEKAFTRNGHEAERLVAAAQQRGVFLMEAMWTRFLPHIDVVRQVLHSEILGEVRTLIADHGQFMPEDATHRLYAPELAGGALLDLGVYPVSFASMVLGPFATVTAVGSKAFTGVDGQTSVVVTTDRGAHGLLSTTLHARTPTTATISGTLARLELDSPFYAPSSVRLIGRSNELLDIHTPSLLDGGLCFEAAEVARCVAAGLTESELMPLGETVQIMRALDDIRRGVGARFPGE
ncbi:Gfo/Idh/MocA family oxidoreductase [Streptomyces sp. NPDC047108]|uniref:Gfo/Idh/MocA family protein n=1 Tax=Streptomyces sp. NPDC047108 TaxID=3155025 RepID=UPI0033DDA3A8